MGLRLPRCFSASSEPRSRVFRHSDAFKNQTRSDRSTAFALAAALAIQGSISTLETNPRSKPSSRIDMAPHFFGRNQTPRSATHGRSAARPTGPRTEPRPWSWQRQRTVLTRQRTVLTRQRTVLTRQRTVLTSSSARPYKRQRKPSRKRWSQLQRRQPRAHRAPARCRPDAARTEPDPRCLTQRATTSAWSS